MEMWRQSWRALCDIRKDDGVYLIPTEGLRRLARALASDDTRLLQGATTSPPPLLSVKDWPVEGADPIAFLGWTDGIAVAELQEFFAETCFALDMALQEPAGCRWLLNWLDDTPRDQMRLLLLAEVHMELRNRNTAGGEGDGAGEPSVAGDGSPAFAGVSLTEANP